MHHLLHTVPGYQILLIVFELFYNALQILSS